MQLSDLGEPLPRPLAQVYEPLHWPDCGVLDLPSHPTLPRKSFADVAAKRQSRRDFGALNTPSLGALLTMSCRVRTRISERLGFAQTSRPAPSAGAIHPIHLVVHMPPEPGWHRYDAIEHRLVSFSSTVAPLQVRKGLRGVVDGQDGTLLLFVAESAMTEAKYKNPASLVWRDAGVLQGFVAAAAEALSLNCCLLGVSGEPWASALVDQPGLLGVGAAYVGSQL